MYILSIVSVYCTVALTFTFADDKSSGIMRQYDYYSKSYSKKMYLHQHITLILDSLIKLFYLILYTIFSHNFFQGSRSMQTDLAYFYDIQCATIGMGSISHLYAITARATLA